MLVDGFHDVPAGKIAMVVTHLEMHAPADIHDVSPPQGVTFEAVEPDITWYRDIFDRVGSEWLWFGRRLLDDATLSGIITDPNVSIWTLQKGGRAEALLELDFRKDGECELAYFGLTASLIGTGAGRYLMTQAIKEAWARPIRRFHVHTCTIDSHQALNFYVRSGFVPYKRQIEIADDPRLTGLVDKANGSHIPIIRA
jgi:GNAT superfamily N-acetyltransferase